ncbi:LysR substrate-binding domain-containing protein [Teichococcus aestuarii]|uniref:LysR substrate-binding domain-containing protein n=1 Tax=Teichococcus aestuarii TaxID=568898 RepID=UPI0036095B67
MHLDLTDLRLFRHVAEAGSITAGGARAGLALASASARLRAMEAQAGVALLLRGRRGIRLTPAGEALLHHARLVGQQVERMRGELGEYARGLQGHVRLLANTAATVEFLPEPLARFLAAHPQVEIALEERTSTAIAAAVAEGRAELGIAADHADLAGLEALPFRTDRLVLVAAPDHPLAGRGGVRLEEALGWPFIGLGAGSALQRHLAGHAARASGRLRLRLQAPGPEAACRMAAVGAGLALVPVAAAPRAGAAAPLALIPLAEAWAERRLLLLHRRGAALPAHAARLLVHLAG